LGGPPAPSLSVGTPTAWGQSYFTVYTLPYGVYNISNTTCPLIQAVLVE